MDNLAFLNAAIIRNDPDVERDTQRLINAIAPRRVGLWIAILVLLLFLITCAAIAAQYLRSIDYSILTETVLLSSAITTVIIVPVIIIGLIVLFFFIHRYNLRIRSSPLIGTLDFFEIDHLNNQQRLISSIPLDRFRNDITLRGELLPPPFKLVRVSKHRDKHISKEGTQVMTIELSPPYMWRKFQITPFMLWPQKYYTVGRNLDGSIEYGIGKDMESVDFDTF